MMGAAVTGLSAALFIWVVERELGLVAFEPVAHLWTIWSIGAAVLTFSVQQAVIVESRSGERQTSSITVGRLGGLLLAMAFVFVVVWLFRDELFSENPLWWALAAAVIPAGSAAVGVTRGRWSVQRRFPMLAAVIGFENLSRLLLALLFIAVGVPTLGFAAVILLGFAVAAIRPGNTDGYAAPEADMRRQNVGLVTTAGSGLFSHLTLAFSPTLLAMGGGSDVETSALFLALALLRAPLLFLHALVPKLAVVVNEMVDSGRQRAAAALGLRIGGGALAGGLLGAAACAVVFGPVMDVIFGADELDGIDYALAAYSVIVGSGVVFVTSVLTALGRTAQQMAGWMLVFAGAIAVLLITDTVGSITGVLTAAAVAQTLMVTWSVALASFSGARPSEAN